MDDFCTTYDPAFQLRFSQRVKLILIAEIAGIHAKEIRSEVSVYVC